MKTLSDGYEVSDRSYYFLLDWNDENNWKFIGETFYKTKLKDLTIDEYEKLFEYATNFDLFNVFVIK